MSHYYFVEILDGGGDVKIRHKFSQLPIRIGRGYSNDIIVDDPHTAAEHAQLDINDSGHIILRDLGSQNGINLNGKRQVQFQTHGDDIFHLGQTQIRVRDSGYQVAPEITDDINHRWQGWPLFFCGVAIISALALSNMWLSDISDSKATAYVIFLMYWLGFAALWSGVWALANRVFGGNAHFSRHLFTLSCGMLALDAFEHVCTFLSFAFSWEIFTRYSSHLQIAIVAVTIYYHLRYVNPRKRARLKIICAALAIAGSGIMLIKNYQATNQYADELYMSEILPPSMRISRNHSPEEFEQSIQHMKTDIEHEREKALKEKQQKNK